MARKARPIWTADAETDPFRKGRVPKPFLWGLYTGEEYHEFKDTAAFVDFIVDKDVVLYAHNGGKFDWHFITEYIEDFEPLSIIAGRIAKFKIGACEFRDSYNIIPAPLAAYQKDEIDYAIFEADEREKPENWAKITSYLKSDCIYLHELVTEFAELYGRGLTQAGSAMTFWSKLSGIPKPQSSALYYERLAPYYYGGRVECFKIGTINHPFKVVDINSAYPFAMLHEHPWGENYVETDTLDDLTDDEISRTFITLKTMGRGAFPFRTKDGLEFPNDDLIRDFHITGHEFLAARDTDCLPPYQIVSVKIYLDTISFVDYVNHFYAMKKEAGAFMKALGPAHPDYPRWAAQYLFAKIFLNSLYGKFASNPEKYETFMTVPASMLADVTENNDWFFCKLISEETAIINQPLEEESRRYYNVAVAASITGFVRAYLWRSIKQCDGVLYCDTDCIVATDVDRLEQGPELGQWELEAECLDGGIAGKKLYAFRTDKTDKNGDTVFKTASKGVRLSAPDILAVARGEEKVYMPDAPTFSVKGENIFTSRRIKRKK